MFILGAGPAGLSAAETARRLGAIVRVFDTRESLRGQVEALGAEFVAVQHPETAELIPQIKNQKVTQTEHKK